jgi:hypothetical protein
MVGNGESWWLLFSYTVIRGREGNSISGIMGCVLFRPVGRMKYRLDLPTNSALVGGAGIYFASDRFLRNTSSKEL